METIKYPFGETPEEVIRERVPQLAMSIWQHEKGTTVSLAKDFRPDDLLTVLNDFKTASETYAERKRSCAAAGEHGSASGWLKREQRSRNLRISILAALGIDEGGE